VSGIVLVVALVYVLMTVLADVMDRLADPRLRVARR
jgi:ABC-type dipeptide/oligopeptide/nickel transport system permease component